jgi:hypothetical protein
MLAPDSVPDQGSCQVAVRLDGLVPTDVGGGVGGGEGAFAGDLAVFDGAVTAGGAGDEIGVIRGVQSATLAPIL